MKLPALILRIRNLRCLFTCGAVLALGPATVAGQPHAAAHTDPAATHNMLLIGEETAFLYHLPMFGTADPESDGFSPHRFQVILEAAFTEGGHPVTDRYFADRAEKPAVKIYTLNPTEFVLARLHDSSPLRSFSATVFRGHLERPGKTPILNDISVDIARVIHFQELKPRAKKASRLEYLLFGKGNELYLAHLLTRAPDFDQILAVRLRGVTLTDDELGSAPKITLPKTANKPAQRLKAAQQVEGIIKSGAKEPSRKVSIDVVRELYFEEGELRLPANFEPTPEEVRAGFP